MIQIDQKRLDAVVQAGSLYFHTPAESAASYVSYADWLQTAPSINYDTRTLDKYILPMRPGEVTYVVARPGNGKTSMLIYMARKAALEIIKSKKKNQCIIYVSWEEHVESIEMSIQAGRDYTAGQVMRGIVDMELVRKNAIKRPSLPLIVLGKSIRDRKRKPPMTLDKVRDTILAIYHEFGLEPILICGDYLQKIPISRGKDRISEVTEAVHLIAELAIDISAPVLIGAQSTREVEEQGLPIPTLSGAQWSSAIEQDAWRMLGLLRPVTINSKSGKKIEKIEIAGQEYQIDKNLMVIRLLKQRKDFPPISTYPVHFDPAVFEMYDIDELTGEPVWTVSGQQARRKAWEITS